MLSRTLLRIDLWIVVIEMVGSLIIVGYCAVALATLVRSRSRGMTDARLLIAQGVLTGLGFKLAGTLLKTILLVRWQQILMFAAIFALRTILKRLFVWEQQRLGSPNPLPPKGHPPFPTGEGGANVLIRLKRRR